MSKDAKQANPHTQAGPENKNSRGRGWASLGERVLTLAKIITLLVFDPNVPL